MIPNTNIREVTSSGVTASTVFAISHDDSTHIMTILRDTLYSDKVLAVLREYSANAWDAHRMSGKSDVPIKVHVPTSMEPYLAIRDFGPGLSHDDAFLVFTQYGKSTKRGSNSAVGMLGIGSKSGFAYSTSWTVTSWHAGKKSIYVAALDKTDTGTFDLLNEEDCSLEETGVEIQVPVKNRDIYDFVNKSKNLFQYFEPRPEINIDLPAPPALQEILSSGSLRASDDHGWVAIMGCVPYRVDIEQLTLTEGFDYDMISSVGGTLKFAIGEVAINASREELKYSDDTKLKLVKKLNELVDEYVTHTLKKLENSNYNPWEKRLEAQILNKLKLEIPSDKNDLFATRVKLEGHSKKYAVYHGSEVSSSIPVNKDVRLVVADDKRALKGYGLGQDDYLVRGVFQETLEDALTDLATDLATFNLTGITIVRLSTLPWTKPAVKVRKGGTANLEKHKVRNFKLIPMNFYRSPFSNAWGMETERDATDDDVFVVINSFKAYDTFFSDYQNDTKLAQVFGITIPEVYGYKTTAAKPVDTSKVQGKEYRVWRKEFQDLVKTKAKEGIISAYEWAKSTRSFGYYSSTQISKSNYKKIKDALGEDHPIAKFMSKVLESVKFLEDNHITDDTIGLMFNSEIIKYDLHKNEAKDIMAEFVKAYPMLTLHSGNVTTIWNGESSTVWMDYIKLVDASNKDKE